MRDVFKNTIGKAVDGLFAWPPAWEPANPSICRVQVSAVGGVEVVAELHAYPTNDTEENRRRALGAAIRAFLALARGKAGPGPVVLIYGTWGRCSGALLVAASTAPAPVLVASIRRVDGGPVTDLESMGRELDRFRSAPVRNGESGPRSLQVELMAAASVLADGRDPTTPFYSTTSSDPTSRNPGIVPLKRQHGAES